MKYKNRKQKKLKVILKPAESISEEEKERRLKAVFDILFTATIGEINSVRGSGVK